MKINVHDVEFVVDESEDKAWWDKINSGKWEAHTFNIFDRFIHPERSYVDLGVWIGPTVLYGASKAKHCYCADPDPKSNFLFSRNLNLNPHLVPKVSFFRGCVGDKNGTVGFGSPSFGDSCSSMFSTKGRIISKSITLPKFFDVFDVQNINFIKIDIEGGEVLVIPSAVDLIERTGATLYLSFHLNNFPDKLKNVQEICNCLRFYKYVYDRNGKEISHEELLEKLSACCVDYVRKWGLFEGVFSNEKW